MVYPESERSVQFSFKPGAGGKVVELGKSNCLASSFDRF